MWPSPTLAIAGVQGIEFVVWNNRGTLASTLSAACWRGDLHCDCSTIPVMVEAEDEPDDK
jgi:hypothetical protein